MQRPECNTPLCTSVGVAGDGGEESLYKPIDVFVLTSSYFLLFASCCSLTVGIYFICFEPSFDCPQDAFLGELRKPD